MIMQSNLGRQYSLYAEDYKRKACEVLDSGWYILGKELSAFEAEWAKYIGSKYCVGLASGLDALWISFRLLNIGAGDEVIVCANASRKDLGRPTTTPLENKKLFEQYLREE